MNTQFLIDKTMNYKNKFLTLNNQRNRIFHVKKDDDMEPYLTMNTFRWISQVMYLEISSMMNPNMWALRGGNAVNR